MYKVQLLRNYLLFNNICVCFLGQEMWTGLRMYFGKAVMCFSSLFFSFKALQGSLKNWRYLVYENKSLEEDNICFFFFFPPIAAFAMSTKDTTTDFNQQRLCRWNQKKKIIINNRVYQKKFCEQTDNVTHVEKL